MKPKEREVKEYLLRAEHVSLNNLIIEDWLRSLGVEAVPQYDRNRRKITCLDFIEKATEIVQSLEHGSRIEDPAEQYIIALIQQNEKFLLSSLIPF
jgi:hypothetical protein